MQLHATVYTEQVPTSMSLSAQEDTAQSKEGRRVCHLDMFLSSLYIYTL